MAGSTGAGTVAGSSGAAGVRGSGTAGETGAFGTEGVGASVGCGTSAVMAVACIHPHYPCVRYGQTPRSRWTSLGIRATGQR